MDYMVTIHFDFLLSASDGSSLISDLAGCRVIPGWIRVLVLIFHFMFASA